MDDSFLDVSGLLEPKSIAVIGASDRSGNLGGDTVRRLVKFKYPGPVWPISRTSSEVAGVKAYPSIAEAPGVADLVVLGIPADGLVEAIGECIDAGVRNGVAYAGGLAEAGGDGARMQAELVDLCRKNDFKLCGPNCVGIINNTTPVTPTFATALHEIDTLRPGPISMVSQSGGLGTTYYAMVHEAGFGFRYMISSGNEAVVSFADYLYALAQDEGTRIIAAYLEGVGNGPKLVRALAEAQHRGKPVVIIKSGASKTSARAAAAHTAALAGEDRVFDAILQEFGAIRVYSIEELLDVTLMLASTGKSKIPTGPGVGIVTFGGGNGVLGADQCESVGLDGAAIAARDAGEAQAAARLDGDRLEPARSHADHGVPRRIAGATSRRARRARRAARHRLDAADRLLARPEGGRDIADHVRLLRAFGQAGVGMLAGDARRRDRAAGRTRHLLRDRAGTHRQRDEPSVAPSCGAQSPGAFGANRIAAV